MKTGYNIRLMRMQRGLSQADLACKVGVTKSMISQIERGTKNMTVELANEIAKALECDIKDFIK